MWILSNRVLSSLISPCFPLCFLCPSSKTPPIREDWATYGPYPKSAGETRVFNRLGVANLLKKLVASPEATPKIRMSSRIALKPRGLIYSYF